MPVKYLLDTCIWRDFYEDRYNWQGSHWGSYAATLIEKILHEKATILYSDVLVNELRKDYSLQEVEEMLNIALAIGLLVRIEITKEDVMEANHLSSTRRVPFADCINSIHARKYSAILVSTDPHALKDLQDISPAFKPEEII